MASPPPEPKPDLAERRALVRALPKVVLHQHLDGSLRPATVLELARRSGYTGLPERDPERLAAWFARGAARGTLGLYLEGFAHTIAVLQDAAALERAAYEALEDLARETVVYAELRFAPHFHTAGGLGLDGVMDAVLRGMQAARRDHGIECGLIVCAMRNEDEARSCELAELALAWRERGCVGFDLAGEEAGHPAAEHARAFELVKRASFDITLHAGESFGPQSIWQALHVCGAHRIGHGVRLVEDMAIRGGEVVKLGPLARYVLDHRVPLELCLSSNAQTGAVRSLGEHPFPLLWKLGFRVTLSPDNSLMSATDASGEYGIAMERFGCSLDDLERISINAMKSAFLPYEQRCALIYERIKRPYAALRARAQLPERLPYEQRS